MDTGVSGDSWIVTGAGAVLSLGRPARQFRGIEAISSIPVLWRLNRLGGLGRKSGQTASPLTPFYAARGGEAGTLLYLQAVADGRVSSGERT